MFDALVPVAAGDGLLTTITTTYRTWLVGRRALYQTSDAVSTALHRSP